MKGSGRLILSVLPLIALAIAFWILVLSPKREEASDLEVKVTDLQAQVETQQEIAAAADKARTEFPRAYRRLVVLGKAAPDDDDTASLLVQLDRISRKARVDFRGLNLEEGESAAAAPAPAGAPQTPAATAEQDEQRVAAVEAETATSTSAPATEAEAALLPIGASVGPAGLPVMRYSLTFAGDFFRLARFIDGLDNLVRTGKNGSVGVRGRLVTIDGFELKLVPGQIGGPRPVLSADFTITTYVTPPDEGTTAGATPAGPPAGTAPTPVAAPAAGVPSTATASASPTP